MCVCVHQLEVERVRGVKYMIAASNWVSFLPTDDYGSAIQRLIAGLKGRLGRPLPRQVDDLKKQGMASLEFFMACR